MLKLYVLTFYVQQLIQELIQYHIYFWFEVIMIMHSSGFVLYLLPVVWNSCYNQIRFDLNHIICYSGQRAIKLNVYFHCQTESNVNKYKFCYSNLYIQQILLYTLQVVLLYFSHFIFALPFYVLIANSGNDNAIQHLFTV